MILSNSHFFPPAICKTDRQGAQYAPSLPKHNIFALTRLDQNRATGQIAHHFGLSVTWRVKTWTWKPVMFVGKVKGHWQWGIVQCLFMFLDVLLMLVVLPSMADISLLPNSILIAVSSSCHVGFEGRRPHGWSVPKDDDEFPQVFIISGKCVPLKGYIGTIVSIYIYILPYPLKRLGFANKFPHGFQLFEYNACYSHWTSNVVNFEHLWTMDFNLPSGYLT